MNPIKEIIGQVQNYEWGKKGNKSRISKFLNNIDPNKHYAELWMGTHQKAESEVIVNNEKIPLSKYLKKKLPYLFKILSINKPLSIQVHPDKETAEELHKENPHIYVDDNHKPEMVYTLSNFEALCGFRSNEEINLLINDYKYIFDKIDKDIFIGDSCDLKRFFTKIMKMNKEFIKEIVTEIIQITKSITKINEFQLLLLTIADIYPNDVGVLALFFLKYIKLSPGKVMYIEANVPHAYLHGDCLEIMATSDNVIRCGLTPKFRDVDLLCKILNYSYRTPKMIKSKYNCRLFKVYEPTDDLGLLVCNNQDYMVWDIDTNYPTIMLVLQAEEGATCNGKLIYSNKIYLLEKPKDNRIFGDCKIVFAYKPFKVYDYI